MYVCVEDPKRHRRFFLKYELYHKRLKLQIAASELYPADYDFSIIFDSVANHKARHQLEKGHYEGNVIVNEWDGK